MIVKSKWLALFMLMMNGILVIGLLVWSICYLFGPGVFIQLFTTKYSFLPSVFIFSVIVQLISSKEYLPTILTGAFLYWLALILCMTNKHRYSVLVSVIFTVSFGSAILVYKLRHEKEALAENTIMERGVTAGSGFLVPTAATWPKQFEEEFHSHLPRGYSVRYKLKGVPWYQSPKIQISEVLGHGETDNIGNTSHIKKFLFQGRAGLVETIPMQDPAKVSYGLVLDDEDKTLRIIASDFNKTDLSEDDVIQMLNTLQRL